MEQLKGLVKKVIGGSCEMEPEQFVAQLAELRTQNQLLHQALQQVQQQQSQQQQQQSQQQSLIQALSEVLKNAREAAGRRWLDSVSLYSAGPTADFPELDTREWQEDDYDQQGKFA